MNEQDSNGYLIREEIGTQPESAPVVPKLPYLQSALDTNQLRKLIEEAIAKALGNPERDGAIDPRHFARIAVTMDDGSEMRGVVYAVERTE